jgi:hypothetical protein
MGGRGQGEGGTFPPSRMADCEFDRKEPSAASHNRSWINHKERNATERQPNPELPADHAD